MPTTDKTTSPPFEIKPAANYTTAEAADWLRCDRQIVYDLIRDGHLAAKRLSPKPKSKIVIKGAALIDYLENLTDA